MSNGEILHRNRDRFLSIRVNLSGAGDEKKRTGSGAARGPCSPDVAGSQGGKNAN